jgi:hypothetical protein
MTPRYMTLKSVAAIALFVWSGAIAHAAAIEFRGFTPGMTLDSFRAHHIERETADKLRSSTPQMDCEDFGPSASECRDDMSALVIAQFVDAKLASASWTVALGDYAGVRDALQKKFGTPRLTYARYHTALGDRFSGEVLTWTIGARQLVLERYGYDRNVATVTIRDEHLSRAYRAKRVAPHAPI